MLVLSNPNVHGMLIGILRLSELYNARVHSLEAVSSHFCAGICCGEFAGQLVEAQSFLCMSLTPASVNKVAQQLLVPTLFFYDWHLPAWSLSLYPEVVTLLTAGESSLLYLPDVRALHVQ